MLVARARRLMPPRDTVALRRRAGRIAGIGVAAVLIAVPVARAAAQEAHRETRQEETTAPGIRVPASIAASAGGTAVLPIEIGPPDAIPARSFVSLRGLPPTVGLRDGHAVGPGAWAVPLSALPSLTALIPADLSGQAEIAISLIAVDGRLLARAGSVLHIGPQVASAAAAAASASAPVAETATAEPRARAERLLARGEAYLANGNIMGARDFLERAADAGLAASALRLAATYDPVVLEQLKVHGVVPDLVLARKWYQRARELGAAEADKPLQRLGRD